MASQTARVASFLTTNKQALINIVGMSMVFSSAIHNFRVKIAWDDREVEFRKLERELDRIKAGVADDRWLEQASEGVRQALKQPKLPLATISQALRGQLSGLVNPVQRTKEDIVVENMNKARGAADTSNAELGGLIGSIVSGSDGKPGGRII